MMNVNLIVTIVRNGWGNKVMEASIKAGAEGGTILIGRGAGVHEREKIFGIPIEPEKEVVLSVTYPDRNEKILQAIVDACDLEKPGAGIAFVVPISRVVGVSHLLHKSEDEA